MINILIDAQCCMLHPKCYAAICCQLPQNCSIVVDQCPNAVNLRPDHVIGFKCLCLDTF